MGEGCDTVIDMCSPNAKAGVNPFSVFIIHFNAWRIIYRTYIYLFILKLGK